LATLFFSYSHRDESLRDELEKHLTMLKRQGRIEAWHDRRIIPGQPLDQAIGGQLDEASIILLLVSSDFLDSEYCYGVEVQHAMERHERGEAVVIPVILRSCDWKSAPFGGLLALPRDGKPVITWADRDEAFLDVTEGIKAVLANRPGGSGRAPTRQVASVRPAARSSAPLGNLDIARAFSEREKDDFLEAAFEQTADLFQNSLAALKERYPGIETRYRRLDANRFTAVIYRNGRAEARCTVWMGGRHSFTNGIGYVENDSGETNSMNESLSVDADGQSLYLKPLGMAFVGQGPIPSRLTVGAAAEYLWGRFLRRLQEHN
jgi:hypothetical protein